ncbi:ATP-binding protein [Armatimonas sp.]|uniref:ATP-binding protein n=1 Tax=Armatimonas sp. TaxID=1872638 RepID=UPI0037510E96
MEQSPLTFLFTDIEGSTPLWERFPVAMRGALAQHDVLLHEAIRSQGGTVFKTVGDAFCAVFDTPQRALEAALSAQFSLLNENWGEVGALKVRMALYGGEAEERGGDYFGTVLNRIARLQDAGHGGQVLVPASLQVQLTEAAVKWVDRGFRRLRGIEEPEHIFQVVADGLPEVFPPLRTQSAHPHNLPSEITSFVGRRTEVSALRHLLGEQRARLVTLTGLGGGGKSRLALHTASDLLWRYPGGIWYVDAVPLSRAEEFSATLLHACGLLEEPNKKPLQQLCEHFKSTPALLLIDSAERFEEIADELAILLKGTEQLQVLATSRTLLYLSMEHEYPLNPLSLPESVELFSERARQARPHFPGEGESPATLEKLCQQLEGTPLAIELAAAQTRSLTLPQIQEALQQRFTVLSSRMRDLHPRHRSLRATIDWSYQTLTDEEQRLFRGISCFAGSFTTDAAQKVCEVLCPPTAIPELLATLRDKSLLRLELESGRFSLPESGRYLLQDSLREYGAEALEQEGAAPWTQLRRRHGEYFQELVQQKAQELRGPQQREALTSLEQDAANIRVAQEHFQSTGQLRQAGRLAVGLGRFWEIRGWLREGRERLLRLLRQEHALSDPLLLTELLLTAGRLEWNGASPELAVRYLERCLDLQPRAQIERTAHTVLGMIAFSLGDLVVSDRHYEAALAVQIDGDAVGEATLKANLGINALTREEFARALPLFEESLVFRQKIGDTVRQAHAWNCIGAAAAGLDALERATAAFSQSQSLYQSLGDLVHAAHARINLGNIAVRQGNPEAALLAYEAALPSLRDTEDWRGIVVCRLGQPVLCLFWSTLNRPVAPS